MCLRVSLPSGHNGVSSVVWTKATKQTTARDASSAHGVPGEAVLRHSVWSVRARAVNLVHRVDRVVVVGPLVVCLFRWLVVGWWGGGWGESVEWVSKASFHSSSCCSPLSLSLSLYLCFCAVLLHQHT